MTETNLKQQFKEFLGKLPLAASEKDRLNALLEGDDGINKVRAELKAVLQLSRNALQSSLDRRREAFESAQEAFDRAEEEFKKAVADIEKEAKDLATAIIKQADKQALEEARKKIA